MSVLHRRLLLALIISAGILNYADRQVIAVLKPLLQEALHWTDSDYGYLTAVFQFAAAFAFLGAGWIVDRVGWRWANPLAVGAWSVAAMAHSLARTLGQFTVARIALGATESLGTPTGVKTIAVLFTARERSIAIGAMNAAGCAGAIVTPLVIPALALRWGWGAAFLVTGGLGFFWVAAWMLLTRRSSEIKPAAAEKPAVAVATEPRVSLKSVLTDRRTWAITGGKVFSDPVWWFLLYWAPDFFHRIFKLNMQGFAVPLAVIYLAAATGSLLAGFASGRLVARGVPVVKARKIIMLISALLVVPVPLALFAPNYWFSVAILSLTLAAHQGFAVNLFALTTDVTPGNHVATTIGIGALFGNLAGMGVLQLAGQVIGPGHGYGLLFGLCSIWYLLGLIWVHIVLPKQNPAQA